MLGLNSRDLESSRRQGMSRRLLEAGVKIALYEMTISTVAQIWQEAGAAVTIKRT